MFMHWKKVFKSLLEAKIQEEKFYPSNEFMVLKKYTTLRIIAHFELKIFQATER